MANASETASDSSFDPETGQLVGITDGIARVTAPNRGPYTFTGTNSFLVGVDRVVVIDPGPNDNRHLKALLAAIGGRKVEAIVLTHTHRDHSGLARKLRQRTKAPIYSNGRHRLYRPVNWIERLQISRSCDLDLEPDEILEDGHSVSVDGIGLSAIATPGHCANHLSFSVPGTSYLFTGDHVMGWSSTVVAPPDGAMGDYLFALEKVIVAPFTFYLPAHGGPIPEGRRYARALLAHRQTRSAQILEAVTEGDSTLDKVVARIYPGIQPALRPAARKTAEAHIDYLVARGELAIRRGLVGSRLVRGLGRTGSAITGR